MVPRVGIPYSCTNHHICGCLCFTTQHTEREAVLGFSSVVCGYICVSVYVCVCVARVAGYMCGCLCFTMQHTEGQTILGFCSVVCVCVCVYVCVCVTSVDGCICRCLCFTTQHTEREAPSSSWASVLWYVDMCKYACMRVCVLEDLKVRLRQPSLCVCVYVYM